MCNDSVHVDVTIGLVDTEIIVSEDIGAFTVCASVMAGELDREITVTLSTVNDTATGNIVHSPSPQV